MNTFKFSALKIRVGWVGSIVVALGARKYTSSKLPEGGDDDVYTVDVGKTQPSL